MSDILDTSQAGPAAVRGGALRVGGYAAAVLLSVGSTAILFRHLGVEDTGRYVTGLSIVAIVGGLTDAGLTAIGVREHAVREPSARALLMRDLVGIRIALTGLGVLGAMAFTAAAGYGATLVAGVLLAGIGLLLQNLQSTLTVPLQTELRFGWTVVADLLRQVVLVAGIVALVVAGADLLPFFAAPIPAALAALVLTAVLVRRSVPLMPSGAVRRWLGLLRETLPYAVTGAIVTVYFRVAIIVVSLVGTERETGLFSASFRVVEVIVAVPQLLAGAAFPIFARAARDDHARLAYGFSRVFAVALILGAGFAIALVAGAGFVIEVIAGPEFSDADDVLRIQALALVASFLAGATGYVLLSVKMYTALMVTSAAALGVTALLAGLLTASMGAEGAAIATVVGEVVLAAGSLFLLVRRHPRLRPSFAVVPRVLAAAVPAAAIALVPGVPEVLLACAAVLVYAVLLLALRAVPDEALDEIRRIAGR